MLTQHREKFAHYYKLPPTPKLIVPDGCMSVM